MHEEIRKIAQIKNMHIIRKIAEEIVKESHAIQVHDLKGMSPREAYDTTQTDEKIHEGYGVR